jgi:hypothetical protein
MLLPVVDFKNQNYKLQHHHLQLQHLHQLQVVAVKVGGDFVVPRFFPV